MGVRLGRAPPGPARPTPRADDRGGGVVQGSSWVASWALVAENRTVGGMPFRPTIGWCLEPGLPRSVGFGSVCPLFAPTQRESALARGQSTAVSSPSQLSNRSCNRSQTPACCRSRRRRRQAVPLPRPNSVGSRRHGQPVRSTKTMPARAARSGPRGGRSWASAARSAAAVRWLPRGRRGQAGRSCRRRVTPRNRILQLGLGPCCKTPRWCTGRPASARRVPERCRTVRPWPAI